MRRVGNAEWLARPGHIRAAGRWPAAAIRSRRSGVEIDRVIPRSLGRGSNGSATEVLAARERAPGRVVAGTGGAVERRLPGARRLGLRIVGTP